MSTYRTEGVILRRSNFGEANLLLHIFTKNVGKIEAVGKSARKPKGKLKGHLEPFLYCDFVLVHGKKMDTVANSFILEPFLNIRSSFVLVLAASVVTEIADRMTIEGYPDERIFNLVVRSFSFLDNLPDLDNKMLWLLIAFFEVNFLSLSGFSPQLDKCVFCSGEISPGKNYFSFSLGGILDFSCAKKIPDVVSIEDDVIKLLRFLMIDGAEKGGYEEKIISKFEDIKKLQVARETVFRSTLLMKNFIEFNIDQKINSLETLCSFAREKI
ncbi:MAG: DNA repair protein RecO [Candidatus Paceibacterota bacterium]